MMKQFMVQTSNLHSTVTLGYIDAARRKLHLRRKGPSINDVTLERGGGGCLKHDVVREVA